MEILVLLLIALVGAIGYGLWKWGVSMDAIPPRGFEVKLTTGEEPVIEKKENDHG